jgi:hypothetical protein
LHTTEINNNSHTCLNSTVKDRFINN